MLCGSYVIIISVRIFECNFSETKIIVCQPFEWRKRAIKLRKVRAWKIENFRACLFVYIKICFWVRRLRVYFVHAKIAQVYACTHYLYVILVLINVHNLHFHTEHFFHVYLLIFTKCYIILFVNSWTNYTTCLKYFVDAQRLYSYNNINNKSQVNSCLTHYIPVFLFYTPWEHQKT